MESWYQPRDDLATTPLFLIQGDCPQAKVRGNSGQEDLQFFSNFRECAKSRQLVATVSTHG